jgi:toxin ParE1/3/4
MAKEYNIIITANSQIDIDEIFAYIEQDSKQIAWAIRDKIYSKIKSLRIFPQKGRIVPELLEHDITNFRELQEYPWRIIYMLNNYNIIITSIVDGRQNVKDLLLRKFL